MTRFWDGRSDCIPIPAFAFGDAGKNTAHWRSKGLVSVGLKCQIALWINVLFGFHTMFYLLA